MKPTRDPHLAVIYARMLRDMDEREIEPDPHLSARGVANGVTGGLLLYGAIFVLWLVGGWWGWW
jgi:hypothetical protein